MQTAFVEHLRQWRTFSRPAIRERFEVLFVWAVGVRRVIIAVVPVTIFMGLCFIRTPVCRVSRKHDAIGLSVAGPLRFPQRHRDVGWLVPFSSGPWIHGCCIGGRQNKIVEVTRIGGAIDRDGGFCGGEQRKTFHKAPSRRVMQDLEEKVEEEKAEGRDPGQQRGRERRGAIQSKEI